jgi:hypothetical protein
MVESGTGQTICKLGTSVAPAIAGRRRSPRAAVIALFMQDSI